MFTKQQRNALYPTAVLGAAIAGAVLASAGWAFYLGRENRQASRLHRTLVELLLNALCAGDPVTFRHSRRVAALSDVLAEELEVPRALHATLRLAALLHDMGKIDDRFFAILHSGRPLTEEERAEIESHPFESAEILRPLEKFHLGLIEIVSSHHECWNGEGYPRGLAGDEIPLGARIVSVADVFDALSQPRPYHEEMPIDEVLDQLRSGAGTRFDPDIVALVESPAVLPRWREIARRGLRQERSLAVKEAERGSGSS